MIKRKNIEQVIMLFKCDEIKRKEKEQGMHYPCCESDEEGTSDHEPQQANTEFKHYTLFEPDHHDPARMSNSKATTFLRNRHSASKDQPIPKDHHLLYNDHHAFDTFFEPDFLGK